MAGGGLIGRQRALAQLEALLDALEREGRGAIVHSTGEPGIGKSTLLAELCGGAEARQLLVLTGRTGEFERDIPFGVFLDALDDYLASLDARLLVNLDAQWLVELASVFPSCARLVERRHDGLQVERYRVYRAVRALLTELASRGPVVLVLDDLHWADAASIELVSYLLVHEPVGPVLVAIALRPGQAPHQLVQALSTATAEGRVEALELSPLTRVETEQLIAHHGGGGDAETLYHQTGGNPFYLEQLLRTSSPLQHEAADFPTQPGFSTPPLVRASLMGELGSLPRSARLLLEAAAVTGDPFEYGLASETSDLDEVELLESLDQLLSRDLIRTTTVPGRFRFRHPIVRQAVYESIRMGQRLTAHRRAADVLESRGLAPVDFAHHLELSAAPGDELSISKLIKAAEAANPRAPVTAARWYAAALRLMNESDPRRPQLLVARATALGAAGRLEESYAALKDALERVPLEPPGLRVRIVAFCATVERLLGHHERAQTRLRRARANLKDPRSAEAAALALEFGAAASFGTQWEEARGHAEEALAISREIGDVPLQVTATSLLSLSEWTLGDSDQAANRRADAATLYTGTEDHVLAQCLESTFFLAWATTCMEQFDQAVNYCDRGITVARATGQGHVLVPLMMAKIWPLIFLGRLKEAIDLGTTAVEISRLAGQDHALSCVLYELSLAYTYTGDLRTGVALAEEGLQIVRRLDRGTMDTGTALALAVALLDDGDPERARRELLSLCGGPDLPRFRRIARSLAYETLTRIEIALGDVDAAEGWAARAEEAALDDRLGVEAGTANRARAAVLLARDAPQPAADLALRAADQAAQQGAPIEAGRSCLVAGRALVRLGQRERAVAVLKRAAVEFGACGAQRYRAEAIEQLERLRQDGRTTEIAVGNRVVCLTPREMTMAKLVAAGRTNREIATACCISEKTVERHLSNIFVKLGVSSRAGVAGLIGATAGRH